MWQPELLRQRRHDLGLTQVELAQLAGVSDRFIRSVESGKTSIQLDALLKVTAILGLSITIEVRH